MLRSRLLDVQVRTISCMARLCRPLPVSTEEDLKKYKISKEFVNKNPR